MKNKLTKSNTTEKKKWLIKEHATKRDVFLMGQILIDTFKGKEDNHTANAERVNVKVSKIMPSTKVINAKKITPHGFISTHGNTATRTQTRRILRAKMNALQVENQDKTKEPVVHTQAATKCQNSRRQ